ncbi:MAG: hypothetical protein IPL51_05925 [Candidatus Competibacteraceae bacterium]|nr:hypothetical protein [Candidatus Competibacteraceae bacterium]
MSWSFGFRTQWISAISGLLLAVWALVQMPGFVVAPYQGVRSIDFHSYRLAADAWLRGENMYPTLEQTRCYWRAAHQQEVDLLQLTAPEQRQAYLRSQAESPQKPGPYLYPPTLALLIAQLQVQAPAFAFLGLLSVLAFGWLWLRVSQASAAWLLLIVFSWDALISAQGANIEIVLLFLTLLATRLIWRRKPVLAAPLVAGILLIKPFYALLFAAFGALMLVAKPTRPSERRALPVVAGLALGIMALEILRWDGALRHAALDYMSHALDYLWLALPPAEQTPFSIWNRNFLQALVNAGLPPGLAQGIALLLWAGLLAVTLVRARARSLTFPLAWALALVLFYLGRPVGWTTVYLEIVVSVALWPWVSVRLKGVILVAAIGLMVSRWAALKLTAEGHTMQFLTLQSAAFPWEVWIVLPACWLLLLLALPAAEESNLVPRAPDS